MVREAHRDHAKGKTIVLKMLLIFDGISVKKP